MPMPAGSARASTSARSFSGSKGIRLPTWSSTRNATSTSAMSSGSPSMAMRTHFETRAASPRVTTPAATSPAAAPAMVGSTSRGNTLFVPVESGTSGASGQMRAIARFVPSPPSTTSAAQPALRIASAARTVSVASSRASTSITSRLASISRFSIAAVETRNGSFITSTRFAPAATAPITMRATWLRLLCGVDVSARAAIRRTSRPESGFAMIPTGWLMGR